MVLVVIFPLDPSTIRDPLLLYNDPVKLPTYPAGPLGIEPVYPVAPVLPIYPVLPIDPV